MDLDDASLADARAIAELHVEAWRAAYHAIVPAPALAAMTVERREDRWRDALAKGEPRVVVARDGGALVGWVSYGPTRDADAPAGRGEIWAIYVAPARLRAGVGTLLFTRARADLGRLGHDTGSLWVLEANVAALAFYRHKGVVFDPADQKTIAVGGAPLVERRGIFGVSAP